MIIVFDASSSKPNFPSLTDYLSPVPNLMFDILIFLLQFRLNKVTITAHIEGAFLQITLAPKEKYAIRFLWVTKYLDAEPEVIRVARVIFVVRFSSFLLNATIKHHIKKFKNVYPASFSIMNSNVYLDHLIHSLENTDLVYTIYEEIKFILGEAGFNMIKWITNVHSLKDQIK